MTKETLYQYNLRKFREYLRDEVIAARGKWDAQAAKDALLDGEWLGKAGEALGIYDNRELDALACELYEECTRELDGPERFCIDGLPAKVDAIARELAERLPELGSLASAIMEVEHGTGKAIDREVKMINDALARMRQAALNSEHY
jgi:hypothetical protein